MSGERLGLVDDLRERTAAVVAANPHLSMRLTGKPAPVAAPSKTRSQPIFPRGRYIPRSLSNLIDTVCLLTDIHRDALTGNSRTRRLGDARSCVAVLAREFASSHGCKAVDDALLRGSGMTAWYRERHEDRLQLYPEYAAMHDRIRSAIKRGQP